MRSPVKPRDAIRELERDARQAEAEGRLAHAFDLRAAAERLRDRMLEGPAAPARAA